MMIRKLLTPVAALALSVGAAAAQPTPMQPITADARTTLKPGFLTAGQALSNMALVSSTPPAPGFTVEGYADSTAPAGPIAENIRPNMRGGPAQGVALSNTDLGFSKGLVVQGNFHGFNIFDVRDPKAVKVAASVVCPGGQGDISIYGNLVFMSVEETRGRLDCGRGGATGDVNAERFRGVRIFDIADLKNIRQVAAVQTCRGSHTHTLIPPTNEPGVLYVYNQGTNAARPAEELAGCSNKAPDEDAKTSLFSIDIIKVPLADPAKAAVISSPRIFADEKTGAINGLWKGGDYGAGTQKTSITSACHDLTAYPQMNLAAGACQGNGILLDISDPKAPKRLDAVADPNFAYWHAAVFNNDATKVVFTDEWGGGTQPRCRMSDPANWGGDIVFDIAPDKQGRGKMTARAHYKLPGAQAGNENCVAHNGGLVPVPGRDIVVQGWYQGGISLVEVTDSAHPTEIASFDRGPLDPNEMFMAGQWGAYWWNGLIYGSEIARGLDILKLTPSAHLTANEIAAAELVRLDEYNPQTQVRYVWPAKPVLARAYLDQLNRDKAVTAARSAEIAKAIAAQGSAASTALAAQLDKDAKAASGRTAERLAGIARVLRAKG